MSYYNIPFKYGVGQFALDAKHAGVSGAIVPDLPQEEASEYLAAMRAQDLAPVSLFAPNTPEERMRTIAAEGSGLVYCVARKGVTGAKTDFTADLSGYLARARRASSL